MAISIQSAGMWNAMLCRICTTDFQSVESAHLTDFHYAKSFHSTDWKSVVLVNQFLPVASQHSAAASVAVHRSETKRRRNLGNHRHEETGPKNHHSSKRTANTEMNGFNLFCFSGNERAAPTRFAKACRASVRWVTGSAHKTRVHGHGDVPWGVSVLTGRSVNSVTAEESDGSF